MKLPFHKLNKYLTASCFLLANAISCNLSGDPTSTTGIWINPVKGNWDVPANWLTTNPSGVYPNGVGDVAAFIGNLVGPATINSNSSITLGSLDLQAFATNPPITFSFTNSNFIFKAGADQKANIQSSGPFVIDTPIQLQSSLDISIINSDLTISKPISGPSQYEVSLFGGVTLYTAENTYLGMTKVNSNSLSLNCTTGPSIAGDLFMKNTVICMADNQFADTTNIQVVGGAMFFDTPNQRMNSIKISNSGQIFGNATLTLLAPKGQNALIADVTDDRCFYDPGNTIFENHGSFFISDGFGNCNVRLTDFDLNNGTVDLICGSGNFLANLTFNNVVFFNGILNIIGKTQGVQGTISVEDFRTWTIPTTKVTDARIIVGTQQPSTTLNVSPSGSKLSLLRNSTLGGVGRIGLGGSANVINNRGTVAPGIGLQNTIFNSNRTLTISGNYTQKARGTLQIKLSSIASGIPSDKLLVRDGAVVLDGTLSLLSLGYPLVAGDAFTIIDNTIGSTGPITGKFSHVHTEIQPGLYAEVTYNPNTVVVTIKSGCPSK